MANKQNLWYVLHVWEIIPEACRTVRLLSVHGGGGREGGGATNVAPLVAMTTKMRNGRRKTKDPA